MTRVLLGIGVLFALQSAAQAQNVPGDVSISTFDPDQAVAPVSSVEGHGIKVGEGTVLHPVFGLETGFISNVFYEPVDPRAAGMLRLLAQIGTGSLSQQRLTPNEGGDDDTVHAGSFQYRASLRASYDLMLSGNEAISGTGGLGLGASASGLVNPDGRVTFGFDENYTRLIRAANFETDADTNRDINTLGLNLLYHPQDRSIGGYLYYLNTIDIFERNQQQFADRLENRFGIHPMWRWLPQTTLYADVSQGVFTGLGNSSQKVTSFPLTALAGISTLLTLKTTLNFQAGYTNGFYSNGPSYGGAIVGAALGYRYSPFGRATLTYDLEYQDSINANYYRDHVIRLWLQHMVAPFVVMAQPELHFRQYNGITEVMGPATRDDVIFSAIAGVHYLYRDWFAITLDYHFSDVSTDYRYMTDGITKDPSFARHELLLGLRIAM